MAKITVTREIEVPDDAPEKLEELKAAADELRVARDKRDAIMVDLKSQKVPLRILADCAGLSLGQTTRLLGKASNGSETPDEGQTPADAPDAASAAPAAGEKESGRKAR